MLDSITDIDLLVAANLYVNGSGSNFQGEPFDSSDFEPGVTYYFTRTATNGGAIVISIEESDDGLSFSVVPPESLIGSLEGIVDNPVNFGEPIPSVGVFSNKRYLRSRLTVTGGGQDPGDDTVVLCTIGAKREILPNV